MCEITIQLCCPHCEATKIVKNGRKANGEQNYRCRSCSKQFQSRYTYRGADPRRKQQIVQMALNASGIRDTARVLKLYPTSVLSCLRSYGRTIEEPDFQGTYEAVELDEFWSFVDRRRTCKRWCWIAWARQERKILAFYIGSRSKKACQALYDKLRHLNIERFYTDDYPAYLEVLPAEKHTIGKQFTTHVERKNRDFRTHLKRLTRRTVCHSKEDDMHYLLIKMYIHHCNVA